MSIGMGDFSMDNKTSTEEEILSIGLSTLETGGISLGIGLINMLIGSSENNAQMARIKEIQRQLAESKIDENERTSLLDRTSDMYNTNILDTLNTNSVSLALSGVENPAVAQGVVTGKLLGERQEALLEKEEYIGNYNRQVDLKIAEVGAGIGTNNPMGDFLTGGVGGLQTALNINDMLIAQKEREDMMEILKNSLV